MDTIAAIATGNQIAAIGVLRVSGPLALDAADRVFRPKDGRTLSAHPRREMVLGVLLDEKGRTLDHALAVTFAAGHSYTGEDCVEFHCHGSPVVLREGLLALFSAGVRQAKGGEFTKRAFLNGRLDLTEAEAVIDLIEAETPAAARNAAAQLAGNLRRAAEEAYQTLLSLSSQFYAVVDYPDEDIDDLRQGELTEKLSDTAAQLAALASSFRRGQTLRRGVPTAILGRANVGKSSLFNALLGHDRAIVTNVPGTTRDTVEGTAVVGGTLLRLTDTAGLRETNDLVERQGIARTRAAAEKAGLALLVLDGSRTLTEEDELAMACAALAPRQLTLVNQCDQPQVLDTKAIQARLGSAIPVSALTGEGLEALEEAVATLFPEAASEDIVLVNPRQEDAVRRAAAAVARAREALDNGLTPDAIIADMEEAQNALGELTGRTAREDMVARIFERFCVGK